MYGNGVEQDRKTRMPKNLHAFLLNLYLGVGLVIRKQ